MVERQSHVVAWTVAKGRCVLIPVWKQNANTVVFVFHHKQQISTPGPPGALGEGRISHFFPIKKINNVTFQSSSCLPCLKLPSWKRKWVSVHIFEVVASPRPVGAHSTQYVLTQIGMKEWMVPSFDLSVLEPQRNHHISHRVCIYV